MAKPWSGWRRSPTNNTANDRGSRPELQEVKMKRMAVMIASLCLITTSWAQGDHTERGRKPMQTVNDSRRSEERRVGKECRYRGGEEDSKKKKMYTGRSGPRATNQICHHCTSRGRIVR